MSRWKIYPTSVSLKSIDVCRVAISPVHKVPLCSKRILEDEAHPLHHRIARQYEQIIKGKVNREEQGLWLIVGANHLQRKRVVRSWTRRRILQAVSQQLKDHGFDTQGRRLKGPNAELVPIKHNVESLIGIVELAANDKSVLCKYEEILRQMAILVQEILARCGSSSGGGLTR